ncbi:MAG TPA: phytanoyl-CoA dioxygenase family protein [Pseudomonadales bacterium]
MAAAPTDVVGSALSAEELAAYRQHGFLLRSSVFGPEEVRHLQAAAERAADGAAKACSAGRTYWLDGKRFVDVEHTTVQFEYRPGSDTVRVIEPAHQLDAVLAALIDDPRLVVPMRQLVGSNELALWTDKLNLKRPREGSGFGWHQDAPYWMHDCRHVDRLPNVMVTFDEATEHNGCFRVIRGSHTRGCLPGRADGTQLGGFYTDPGSFDVSNQVLMEAPAGSAIFFDAFTVHGSLPNTSDLPRRAMVITYQPAGFPMLKSGRVRNVPDSRGSE